MQRTWVKACSSAISALSFSLTAGIQSDDQQVSVRLQLLGTSLGQEAHLPYASSASFCPRMQVIRW